MFRKSSRLRMKVRGQRLWRPQLRARKFLGVALFATLLAGLAIWRLADHDLDRRNSESFDVSAAGQSLGGTLWLPDETPQAAIVLVHGDGPQDRTSSSGYAPLINVFLDAGIAVAAWDKPGVGESGGNWLHQSMADRSDETRAALDLLDQRFEGVPNGALGFSQAGWVLPRLTPDDADFLVLIGAAVSWQDQGAYYTRTRLGQAGLDAEAIEQTLEEQEEADERAFGEHAQPSDAPEGMSQDRWRFIRENRDADARAALARLDLPLFAVWGADDLNVDAENNAATYTDLVAGRNANNRIIIWPDATHGLLKARAYNWQLIEQWSWFATLRFLAEGRHAFAPGSLDAVTEWIRIRAVNN